MSDHTNEPWYVGAQNDGLYITSGKAPAQGNDSPNHDADRTVIAKLLGDNFAIAMPDARRIVACVNYCSGLKTEDMERHSEMALEVEDEMQADLLKALEQRDKLLAALSELIEVTDEPPESNCSCHISPPCNDCVEYSGIRQALECARAAIKDVEAA